jgi:hypothetical protein
MRGFGRGLVVDVVRQTGRIGEHSNGTIDVHMATSALGEPHSDVERDIVQCMQFANDDAPDQLIDADWATRALVIVLMVDLIDQITPE